MKRTASLKRTAGLRKSYIKRSTKPIPKVNPKRKAKRKIAYRKMLSGKEYKLARAEAFERAGNRCEQSGETSVTMRSYADGAVSTYSVWRRCDATENLHAHHLRYPKSRPLEARDLLVCCKPHHEYLESLKPHKQRMYQ